MPYTPTGGYYTKKQVARSRKPTETWCTLVCFHGQDAKKSATNCANKIKRAWMKYDDRVDRAMIRLGIYGTDYGPAFRTDVKQLKE